MLRRAACNAYRLRRLSLAVLLAVIGLQKAGAAEPAALVEQTSEGAGGPPPMAYLSEGTRLMLGPSTRIVLDYLASCTREVVVGGELRVGHGSSEVSGGRVTRTRADCGTIALALPDDQIDQSGVAVARAQANGRTRPAATQALFSRYPVFADERAEPGSMLWIEPIDGSAPMLVTTMQRRHDGRRGAEVDFLRERLPLPQPGRYRASSGSRSLSFEARFEPWMAIWPRRIEF